MKAAKKGSKVVTVLNPILKSDEDDVEIEEECCEEDKKEDKKEDENRFKCLNDFKKYYEENKDRIDGMSTIVLNKTYKIDGYTIRKNYGVIGFRPINCNPNKIKNEKRIERLEDLVNKMIEVLNKIQEQMGML
jgi:hypothetical protein